MAAEFYISFSDTRWYATHRSDMQARLLRLTTFVGQRNHEFRLRGVVPVTEGRWDYDVRLIFLDEAKILMEISAHPKSIEEDLASFLASLRSETEIAVVDEDGEPSGW